jgi:hypothetical protein
MVPFIWLSGNGDKGLASGRRKWLTIKVSFFILPQIASFSPLSFYDFTTGQFRKEIWAIVILMNFPVLKGFKSCSVLDNLYPNLIYRTISLKMAWKLI